VSLIINRAAEDFAGLTAGSWLDDAAWRLDASDRRRRVTRWVRSIILHGTGGGWPQTIQPGAGPVGLARRTANAWRSEARHAGSHLIIDGDGMIWCLADLAAEVTYHAREINEVSIGIELAQSRAMELWEAQLDAAVVLLDVLTRRFGIQRQFHAPYRDPAKERLAPVRRLAHGGSDCVGIFGHRDQTSRRGRGDPGDAVFERLARAGYEPFDLAADADLVTWRGRQAALGVTMDGIAGPKTVAALRAAGMPHGMWVERPGDVDLGGAA
jgi:hypothetical protein